MIEKCQCGTIYDKEMYFLIYSYIAPGNFSLLAQRKVAEKESALVRSPLEIFTLKIKFISCNVQKLACAQTFELKTHLINFIFNSLRYRENTLNVDDNSGIVSRFKYHNSN